jgi:hypothetical protein
MRQTTFVTNWISLYYPSILEATGPVEFAHQIRAISLLRWAVEFAGEFIDENGGGRKSRLRKRPRLKQTK